MIYFSIIIEYIIYQRQVTTVQVILFIISLWYDFTNHTTLYGLSSGYAYFKFGTVVHDFGLNRYVTQRLIAFSPTTLHCTPLWWKRIRVNSGKCICDGTREAYYNIWDGYTAVYVYIEEVPLGLLTTRCICISINNYNAFRISEHTWRVRFQDECPRQVVGVNGLFTCV